MDHLGLITLFAQIKVKTIIALVSYVLYWHLAASIAFDSFFDSLSGFDNDFNPVFLGIVASDPQAFVGRSKIAVLAQTKMRAIRTNKTSTYNWFHIAADAFEVAVSGQSVSK
jgi:hypothetical protein